jgi:hypothetical protein
MSANEFAQVPPHAVANPVANAGKSERTNITNAVRRNVRIGFDAALAIAANVKTAPVVRMAVWMTGKPNDANKVLCGPASEYADRDIAFTCVKDGHALECTGIVQVLWS